MNRPDRFTFIVIFILSGISSGTTFGQKILIKNRDDFSVSAGYCTPLGSKYLAEQPTLIANMRSGISVEARYLTSLLGHLRAGITVSRTQFTGWDYLNNRLFKESSALFLSFGTTLAYRTWSPGKKLSNRLNFYGAITPGLSKIDVLTNSHAGINSGSETNPLSVNSMRFFTQTEGGVYFNASQNVSLFISANYYYTLANSQVFTDKSFSFTSFHIGASARLVKDRRYKFHID